jgi:chromosome segregation ATPase
MLGQTPFVGYAIVDFAPAGELDVELDSDFLPTGAEEPEWFIAVAARETAELGAFNIVQLPATRVVGAGTDDKLAEELRSALAREAGLEEKLATVTAENAKAAAERRVRKTESNARIEELTGDVQAKNARIVDLEATRASLEAELKGANHVVETLRERAAAADAAVQERDAAMLERTRLEEALRSAEADTGKEADIAKLEGLLSERGEQIRKLETDLREAERLGKELVREVARASGRPEGEQTQGGGVRSEALTAENAKLRADLEAAQWTIQELENRLDHAMRRPTDSDAGKSAGSVAETEA